jgi:ribosomal protein S18 acetylase RimI-like enzyme
MFAARRAGVVVGFGRVMRDKADVSQWLLFALAVHPEHRRQGIGTALARARIEYAKQHGARCIRSETHVDNAVSIRYHESMGFRCDGEVTAPDGDRLVRFQLPLG